jgi:hypothetical protein
MGPDELGLQALLIWNIIVEMLKGDALKSLGFMICVLIFKNYELVKSS